MVEEGASRVASKAEMHRRFQTWMAGVFLTLAAVSAAYIFWGPRPESTMAYLAMLLFVELPLFVVFALVGVHSLVKRATGPKK